MTFWIAVAFLAAAVTYAVARPLASGANASAGRETEGLAVYKDQLKEIAADQKRGLLSEAEAEATRAEVSRRLIRASDASASLGQQTHIKTSPLTAIYYAMTLALPLLSVALYLNYGAPGMPAQPYAQRLKSSADTAKADDLIAQVEARLRDHPDDGRGWEVVAPVYMAQRRFQDAAEAYATALRILGETAPRLEGFAMARIRADNGLVANDARKALERSLILDGNRFEPRVWLALAKEQDGDLSGAISDYKAMLAAAPVGAPWRKAVEERMVGLAAKPAATGKVAGAPTPASPPLANEAAPSRPDAAAIAALPPEERERMIGAMVQKLADRLKTDGNDLAGWSKLIRAYKVMGRNDDAASALGDAKKQFAGDERAAGELDTLAGEIDIKQ